MFVLLEHVISCYMRLRQHAYFILNRDDITFVKIADILQYMQFIQARTKITFCCCFLLTLEPNCMFSRYQLSNLTASLKIKTFAAKNTQTIMTAKQ